MRKSLSNPEAKALIRTCQNRDQTPVVQSLLLPIYSTCSCVRFEPPNVLYSHTLRSMICLLDFQSEYNGLVALASVGKMCVCMCVSAEEPPALPISSLFL